MMKIYMGEKDEISYGLHNTYKFLFIGRFSKIVRKIHIVNTGVIL